MIPKSFITFQVSGDAPKTADETAISILSEFAFKEQEIGVPQVIEVGFCTGEDVLDTQFTYAKNGYGPVLCFAMRIDTHKVPSNIKQAYKRQNERAVASNKDNALGFLSKAERQDVREQTNRQLQEELAAGKYRKHKMVPIIWDLKHQVLHFGSTTNDHVDELHKLMCDSFNVELDHITAGGMARKLMQSQRDFEDVRPLAFTQPPAGALENQEAPGDVNIPLVPWATSSVDMKDFLGNEFLMWSWWILETQEATIDIDVDGSPRKDAIGILFDRTLNMECAWEIGGKQALACDGPTRLVEAADALITGKWPRKAGLIIADGGNDEQWELSLQSDIFHICSVKLPNPDEAQSPREVTEHRIASTCRLYEIIQGMFKVYLKERFKSPDTVKTNIANWINSRKRAS